MDPMLIILIIFAIFGLGVLLLVIIRAPTIPWLATKVGCPNCSSKKVKQIGPKTLKCNNCGSIFRIRE